MISVIIPTLNEARCLGRVLAALRSQRGVETIVVDGGSSDETLSIAARAADRVLHAPRGRAQQLNAGAAAATGTILLFLHADTVPQPGALPAAREALCRPRTVGGAFRLRIDSPRRRYRVVSFGINLRAGALRTPYGDQAVFVRRGIFRSIGGFRRMDIMEDLDFILRLRRAGRVVMLPQTVSTSPRRWEANGLVRTTLVNWSSAALFALGVCPAKIRRFYEHLLTDGRTPATERQRDRED